LTCSEVWRVSISHREFTYRWVRNLVDCIDAHLDEGTKAALMESCGRACAREGPVRVAEACHGDVEAWLSALAKWHGGAEYVQRQGDVVRVICRECLCELVKDGPAQLPNTSCNCSLGWMKEVFGTVVGKPVDVDLVESIKRGAERCMFVIHL